MLMGMMYIILLRVGACRSTYSNGNERILLPIIILEMQEIEECSDFVYNGGGNCKHYSHNEQGA
ncbi:hypothetical protein GCM10007140_31820 [Priestia taiwanensis]|uniref:Uncharacterized protein n=1 Tax=Priestia taiwanensis TaxID=1347902 RepID=A0A917AXI3_9BACI|nr:hypothetical protein GCM10007140_31820 [Priestia taiwanensis]